MPGTKITLNGFAAFDNAQGGVIFIGKDDNGKVTGVEDSKRLMDDIHKFLIRKVSFEGLHRRETPEYPITALREVILNALVHRNYRGAPTQIRVYDDKITFWNDGRLSEELTLDALKKPHSSKPRNPVTADVCFKGNLIDAWGRGTIKVIDTCIEAELPEPELAERDGGFLVTLFGKGVGVNVGVKVRDKFRKEVIETLTLIERNPEYTTEQIAEITNKAKRTIKRHIAKLKNAGILERKGSDRVGYWEVNIGNE